MNKIYYWHSAHHELSPAGAGLNFHPGLRIKSHSVFRHQKSGGKKYSRYFFKISAMWCHFFPNVFCHSNFYTFFLRKWKFVPSNRSKFLYSRDCCRAVPCIIIRTCCGNDPHPSIGSWLEVIISRRDDDDNPHHHIRRDKSSLACNKEKK